MAKTVRLGDATYSYKREVVVSVDYPDTVGPLQGFGKDEESALADLQQVYQGVPAFTEGDPVADWAALFQPIPKDCAFGYGGSGGSAHFTHIDPKKLDKLLTSLAEPTYP